MKDSFTDLSQSFKKRVKRKTALAFAGIGFLVDIFFYTNLSSSQDILQGTSIPTAFVFLSSTGPACLATALYPFLFQKIPVPLASCVIFVVSVAGMLITSIIQEPSLKLVGVCLVSFGYGSLDTIFYPLSVFYGKATVDSYTIGGGIATFAAPLIYLGLTTLVCLSPEVTILLVALSWILFPIAYKGMDGLSDKIREKSHPTSHTEVPYNLIEADGDDSESESKLLCADMTRLVWKSQVPFMALFTSSFSKQLLVGGVVTTLAFDKTPVTPRNQYIFYMLALGLGDLLGRSYLGILSMCCIESKFKIKKTWILAFGNLFLLVSMIFVSWFRLFASFYTVFAAVLVNSFVYGAVFVNSFHNAGEGMAVSEKRFCRALLAGATWSASTVVSLIGWDTEVRLRRQCLAFNPEVVCYTRALTRWNPSEHCVSYQ
ncbi:PREDICTED: battenin-like isoform X1 [Acropora digitifera]|uniref:battenin-like isoform X1 n=1 Tax=Acropora digitifera TaxID=70779 RepID=UPI000779F29A|nr:PREDICTED: battenin-like isoform X1 [Acropora digitifera]